MIDHVRVKDALESAFYIFQSSEPVREVHPQDHILETEEDLRCSLYLFDDKGLRGIIAGVLLCLLADRDKSGIDYVVRALAPQESKTDQQYNEGQRHRFDGYDVDEAKAILLWLSYVRPLQWGVEDNDMDAAESFWTAKSQTFRNERNRRAAKRERAKRKQVSQR